jgi:hypothetical protein|tara:strand:+ start:907 stop:1218 length:312 start_codon:yes stop_codon:yes gene_type:complete
VKTRKLIDGREAQELDQPIKLLIETKCPSKWKIIDMETGQAYIGTNTNKKFQYWQPVDEKQITEIQTGIKELNDKLTKHIDFIEKTYEGLRNPIDAARRWLGK